VLRLRVPYFPEIGPAQEEGPAGLEEASSEPPTQATDVWPGREKRKTRPWFGPSVAGSRRRSSALRGPGPGGRRRVSEETGRARREFRFAPDESEVDREALEIDPGGDVGGQGELAGRGTVRDDDGESRLSGSRPVEVEDGLAGGEEPGQAVDAGQPDWRRATAAEAASSAFFMGPSPAGFRRILSHSPTELIPAAAEEPRVRLRSLR